MTDYQVHDLEVRRTFAGCLVTNRCAPITLTHEEARSLAVFLLSGIDDRPTVLDEPIDLEGEFNSALTAMGDPFLDDPNLEEDYHPALPCDLEEHDRLAQEDSDRHSDSPWEYQAGRIPN